MATVTGDSASRTRRDGRYVGDGRGWRVELRVDVEQSGIISGVINPALTAADGVAASFRTLRAVRSLDEGEWQVGLVADGGGTGTRACD